MVTRAGEGEHHPYYPLKDPGADPKDTAPFEAGKHYIGIDAVRWYVNQQGNILHKRMASGTFEITLENETYAGGLGTYELKSGAQTAPVFDQPILNNRVFWGGRVRIKVYVRAIQQNTLLGSLLQDMARASIGVVAGAVSTATVTGPSGVLLAAGNALVAGVRKILEEDQQGITVLEPSGVEINISLTDLKGARNYVLIHRGAFLDQDALEVAEQGAVVDVLYKERPLDDGAWILLRLRREDSYGDPRPWAKDAEEARSAIDSLMDGFHLKAVSSKKALKALAPGEPGSPSVYDKVISVVNQIRADHVVAEREAIKLAGGLTGLLDLAMNTIRQEDISGYRDARERAMLCLDAGVRPNGVIAAAFENEAVLASLARAPSLRGEAVELSGNTLWRTLRYVRTKT